MWTGLSQEMEQASIECLTESFIAGLQAEFPSTTSTVFRFLPGSCVTHTGLLLYICCRTGDKLTVGGDEKSERCALCEVIHRLLSSTIQLWYIICII